MIWTKETIDNYVENVGGGCSMCLYDTFPYTPDNSRLIQNAWTDESVNDSEFCDYLLEIAYKQIN